MYAKKMEGGSGAARPFLAAIIRLLHLAFVVWFVVAPFTNVPEMLVLHAIVAPFLWLHWILNQDGCFLTLVEKKLRGVEDDKSFFHNLLSPIYLLSDLKDSDIRFGVMMASVLLWLVTVHKLSTHPEYLAKFWCSATGSRPTTTTTTTT